VSSVLRVMRWAFLVVIVAGSIAMAMVLATPERDPDAMEFHAPATEQERVVTVAGLAYLRALRQRAPEAACRYAAGSVRREMRCSSRPRLADEIEADSPLRPFHIRMHGAGAASLWVSARPGPVEGLELELLEGRWRVIDHRGFGFA
jgi:hypothetical protein